ncbi:MAG: hypothetical protein HY822_21245 [Acidobacteria bacterium]|nr:hypothetical protein [Acidobacteriota bacterium]
MTGVTALAQYSQPVRDVENPARSPFWSFDGGPISLSTANVILNMGTVPAGQRLVIEHVAVQCTGDADDNISQATISVYKKTGGGWTSWSVPLAVRNQGTGYDGKGIWTASQVLRLYSDGVGSATWVNVHHRKTTSTAHCFAVVSGNTISTP